MSLLTSKIAINRFLQINNNLASKSHFLLGPRQTGKSVLIQQQLPGVKIYNLLLLEDFRRLNFDPSLIRKELTAKDKLIVVDEIQRIPELLNEIHYIIEQKGVHFLLTGSSVRKLKKHQGNLLGGRARLIKLHPFVYQELKEHFDLEKVINFGLIPSIYFSDQPELDLNAYIALYLEQEIGQEGAVRSLPTFSRFLEIASLCNGEQVDYTSVANDAQIPRTTIHEYFKILEDTLIGYFLPVWKETKKRKPVSTPKFYFFDWGVARKLQGISHLAIKSPLFGKAFESYLFHEIKSYCDYHHISDLHYWRTTQQDEVDFIINNAVAVEVKGSDTFKGSYIKSLVRLQEDANLDHYILVYLGPNLHLEEYPGIKILNYQFFLEQLYQGNL